MEIPEGSMAETASSGTITVKVRQECHTYRNKQSGGTVLERLHDLKSRICDFGNLMCAYREASKGKRYRNEVLSFRMNLCENILQIQKELLTMTYKVGPYREFYIQYPKPRLVMALGFRDRIVQWAIYRQLNPYLDKRYIAHSYGCRENKGTLKAAEQLLHYVQEVSRKPDAEEWLIVYGDVSKFFYRVDHVTTLQMYHDISDDLWFDWLMGSIINNPDMPFGLPLGIRPENCPKESRLFDVGMPIGNLTSQSTANFYLNRLDQFVKHSLHVHMYVRYMDDYALLVHGKEAARKVFAEITDFLMDKLKLATSPKSQIQKATDPIEFCGYVVTPYGLRVRKKTTRHVKRSTKHLTKQAAAGEMEKSKAKESTQSYCGLFLHVNGHDMLRWIKDHTRELEKITDKGTIKFYTIKRRKGGLADVFLFPDGFPANVAHPSDTNIRILAVYGLEYSDGLAIDIRMRYDAWCDMAEDITVNDNMLDNGEGESPWNHQ